VELTVTDDEGLSDSCTANVTVVDEEGPVVQCNAPDTISPFDAPISFTATATDNCDEASVEIIELECFKLKKNEDRIDKTELCEVSIVEDTITILDARGVINQITWTVVAQDGSGNQTARPCEVLVVKKDRE
jgi:hypothetical protein